MTRSKMDRKSSEAFEELIEKLSDKMAEETSVYRELIRLTEEEQKFLVRDDVEHLARNTEEMNAIIEALKKCQADRKRLVTEVGAALGIEPEGLSISSIAERLETDVADELKERSKDLVRTGEKLYMANRNTVYLVSFSLDLLEQQSKLWAELLTEQEGYGRSGKAHESDTSPLLVQEKV